MLYDDILLGYITGLLTADGHLPQAKNSIRHKFSCKDEEHMSFVYSNLVNEKVSFKTPVRRPTIRVFSPSLKSLKKYLKEIVGLDNNKTYTCDIDLSRFNEAWVKSFLAGYLDGDGHVYVTNKRYNCRIGFVTSSNLINNIQNYLGYGLIHNQDTYKVLHFTGTKAYELATYLLGCQYQMPRKAQRLSKIIDMYE